MALAASSSFAYSTKAKPRGLPLSRSIGRKTSRISPICENSVCTSVRVVLKSKLPTNTFADINPVTFCRRGARHRLRQGPSSQTLRPPGSKKWGRKPAEEENDEKRSVSLGSFASLPETAKLGRTLPRVGVGP